MKARDMVGTVLQVGYLHRYAVGDKDNCWRWVTVDHEGNRGYRCTVTALAYGGFTALREGDTVRVTSTKNDWTLDDDYIVSGILTRGKCQ
jgi:hypothetical protein